jgi:hypothetical protein
MRSPLGRARIVAGQLVCVSACAVASFTVGNISGQTPQPYESLFDAARIALPLPGSRWGSKHRTTSERPLAQTFLQLVLLPIIIVGQNVQAAATDARSQATYDDAAAVLEESKQIQAHLAAQDAAIEKILAAITPKST